MSNDHSAVGIFDSHLRAEDAVQQLHRSGLDTSKLSIVGRDQETDEQVVGWYNTGHQMMYWGKRGAVPVCLWGVMFGAGLFWVPGLGPCLVAGPLMTKLVGPKKDMETVGGLSAVGAGLYSMGIPRDSILKYENAIKTGTFLLIYHGTTEEAQQTCQVLDQAKALETALHGKKQAVVV